MRTTTLKLWCYVVNLLVYSELSIPCLGQHCMSNLFFFFFFLGRRGFSYLLADVFLFIKKEKKTI